MPDTGSSQRSHGRRALAAALALGLVACAGDAPRQDQRAAWAVDLQLVFAGLKLQGSTENVRAVLAVTEQESTFNPDPPVANLARIAREEIMRRADELGVPELAVNLALKLRSSDGKSYNERLSAVKTERELRLMYGHFIDEVPLGRRLFANRIPVRTGGPMPVSIAFAEEHVRAIPTRFRYRIRCATRSSRGAAASTSVPHACWVMPRRPTGRP